MTVIPSEAVKPIAEATKAVAETTGKALDIVSATGAFSMRLIGDAVAQGGGMMTDQVAHWRKMRLLELEAKFNAACGRRNMDPQSMRPLSLSQTAQVLEGASMEESDDVQALWAELLANAVDPQSSVTLKKMYLTILRELGPAEAVFLNLQREFECFRALPQLELFGERQNQMNALAEATWRRLDEAERISAISNLRRLGCVAATVVPPLMLIGELALYERTSPREDVVDAQIIRRLIQWAYDSVSSAGGIAQEGLPEFSMLYNADKLDEGGSAMINVGEYAFKLTPLGREFLGACVPPTGSSPAAGEGPRPDRAWAR